MSDYGYPCIDGSECVYANQIRDLKAEVDNLKAIMKGEGGTKKVNLDDRYGGRSEEEMNP